MSSMINVYTWIEDPSALIGGLENSDQSKLTIIRSSTADGLRVNVNVCNSNVKPEKLTHACMDHPIVCFTVANIPPIPSNIDFRSIDSRPVVVGKKKSFECTESNYKLASCRIRMK